MCKFCNNKSMNVICDNDCGTIICSKCENEWYFVGKVKKIGHNPNCSLDEEDEEITEDIDEHSDIASDEELANELETRANLEDDVIFSKEEEEEDTIFKSDDEENSEEESDNDSDEPIIDEDDDSLSEFEEESDDE